MNKRKADINISIFECETCECAHLAIVNDEGEVLFSAGLPPEIWAAIFRDVAKIESKHAAKH